MQIPTNPMILELLPEFIDSWLEEIENEAKNYFIIKDSTSLYRLGHTIKGSCLQFEMSELAEFGINIMQSAKELNWDEAQKTLEKVKICLLELKQYLDLENNKVL